MQSDFDVYALMRVVIGVEAVLIGVCVIVILGLGGRTQRAIRAQRDRRRSVTAAIARFFDDGEAAPALTALRTLEPDERAALLLEVARTLHGTQFNMLGDLAQTLGTLDEAQRDCVSKRWWKRLHGARLLSVLGGGDAVLPAMFDDTDPLVRAQVAEWASTAPTREHLHRLCAMLDDPIKLCRHTAADSLLRIGSDSVPVLLEYLNRHTGDSAMSALRIAVELSDARFLPAAQQLADSPSPQVREAVARLLGRLGGDDSAQRLVIMLDDVSGEVRAAACAALGGLAYWPAAPRIAEQLRHPSWVVRRTAALALRRIGSTGVLLLRHALNDPDAFASDAARQVLGLPEMAAHE